MPSSGAHPVGVEQAEAIYVAGSDLPAVHPDADAPGDRPVAEDSLLEFAAPADEPMHDAAAVITLGNDSMFSQYEITLRQDDFYVYKDHALGTVNLLYAPTGFKVLLPSPNVSSSWVVDTDGELPLVCEMLHDGSVGVVRALDHDLIPTLTYQDRVSHDIALVSPAEGENGWGVRSAEAADADFEVLQLDFIFASTMAKSGWPLASFVHPRDCCHVYFSCYALHTILGVTGVKALPCKWVARYAPVWARVCRELGFEGIEKSVDAAKPDQQFDKSRVLPFPAVDAMALLALTSRWAFLPKQHGGFDDARMRRAASDVLGTLMESASSAQEIRFPGFLRGVIRGRAGEARGSGEFVWKIHKGMLDLVSLTADAEIDARNHPANGLAALVRGAFPDSGRIPLMQFVAFARRERRALSLLKQFLWGMGMAIDSHVLRLLAGDEESDRIQGSEVVCERAKQHAIDKCNYLYDKAAVDHIRTVGGQFLSASTDKGRVRSMGQQNTLFVTPDNKAWWGLTQDCTVTGVTLLSAPVAR